MEDKNLNIMKVYNEVMRQKQHNFIFTIGYGRSGSTLIGHILNNHPNLMIANESRFFQQCSQGIPYSVCIKNLCKNAMKDNKNGINMKYKHQSDSKNMPKLRIPKEQIYAIGDKKSGGNTIISLKYPLFFNNFLESYSSKLILILRNPCNIMYSCKKSGIFNKHSYFHKKINKYTSDDILFHDILSYLNHSLNIYRSRKDISYLIYYEDFLLNPKQSVESLFQFIGVKNIPGLEKLINSEKKEYKSKIDKKYTDILLSTVSCENMCFFERYIY